MGDPQVQTAAGKSTSLTFKEDRLYEVGKRLLDLIGSSFGILLLFPLFIFISLFYFFGENKGPVLFKQARTGKNGKQFYMYKFRSMILNAEEKLKVNKQLYDKYLKNNYKLEPNEDPRITPFGNFIRKTSLDELPQLINVFKGEMSLVGPRPVVPEELNEYKEKKHIFLSVKPGVTGYWQISGRSNIGYPDRVELELYYVYNQSFRFDIYILIKTLYVVFVKRGAY